ncbi:hypothetical protein [Haloferula sp.]|uniref:hypothetical protein n=1 Tax=Haloferula sp. TaxID=2497595 RepID=UPI003C7709A8
MAGLHDACSKEGDAEKVANPRVQVRITEVEMQVPVEGEVFPPGLPRTARPLRAGTPCNASSFAKASADRPSSATPTTIQRTRS